VIQTSPREGVPKVPHVLHEVRLECGHVFLSRGGVADRSGTAPRKGDVLFCVRCDGPSTVPGAPKALRSKRDAMMPDALRRLAASAREEGWTVQKRSGQYSHRPAGWDWRYSSVHGFIHYIASPTPEWWAETLATLREIGAPTSDY
jgi:hypothetical protein